MALNRLYNAGISEVTGLAVERKREKEKAKKIKKIIIKKKQVTCLNGPFDVHFTTTRV